MTCSFIAAEAPAAVTVVITWLQQQILRDEVVRADDAAEFVEHLVHRRIYLSARVICVTVLCTDGEANRHPIGCERDLALTGDGKGADLRTIRIMRVGDRQGER